MTLEPPEKPLPELTARARAYLARVDPAALAAHEAWAREVRAAIGAPRPLAFTVARHPDVDDRLDISLATEPPPGGRVVVTVTGIGSPEGPLRRETPERRVESSGTLFALIERDCASGCEPSAVALEPTHRVDPDRLREALRVTDITRPAQPRPVTPEPRRRGDDWTTGLESLGFAMTPGHRYAIRVDAGLEGDGGVRLAAPWCAIVDVGLPASFTAFGIQGTAVWEAGLGPRLPLLTRSLVDVRGGAAAIAPEEVVPALRSGARFGGRWQDAPGVARTVTPVPGLPDGEVREVLVNVAAALSPAGTGLIWAAYPGGREAPGVSPVVTVRPVPFTNTTLIQVTNIGLTVRGTEGRLAILASRLDTGAPIANADVTVLDEANRVLWHGSTDGAGLGDARPEGGTPYVVLVRSAADVAFVPVPYSSGRPWRDRELAGVLFTDRGLYRPGEIVHVRAFVQEPRPEGLRPIPAGTTLTLALEHEGDDVATHDAVLDAVGGAEWTIPIPESAKTDDRYRLVLRRDGDKQYGAELACELLIKAFRPAEFGVDLTATSSITESRSVIEAAVAAHDLSEVALAGAPVFWKVTRDAARTLPGALERDREFRYAPFDDDTEQGSRSGDGPLVLIDYAEALDAEGRHALRIALPGGLVGRGSFTVAAQVRDASSQVIGREVRAEIPADVYLGVTEDTSGMPAEAAVRIVARTPEGALVPGIAIDVRVHPCQGPGRDHPGDDGRCARPRRRARPRGVAGNRRHGARSATGGDAGVGLVLVRGAGAGVARCAVADAVARPRALRAGRDGSAAHRVAVA